jgi:hypothetical protein
MNDELMERIASMVRMVEADERRIGVLSTGEQIAVALVLDRKDLLANTGYPRMLEAVDRLGESWFYAALQVQREGWQR